MYKLIFVFRDGSAATNNNGLDHQGKEVTISDWSKFFLIDDNLEYLEYRTSEGKKHREYTRANYYKHLAGGVK